MTSILEKILAHKREEVAERKALYPEKLLERSLYFDGPTVSLRQYLRRPDKDGVIAEFKRQSPSKGAIAPYADPETVSLGYMQAGAAALSVLTDKAFFGGSSADLETVRKFNYCPILRKDFIVDEYQLIEARANGADAVLLIAAALDKARLRALAAFAAGLDLEVLVEVHSREELDLLPPDTSVVGVNNRDLKTFQVSLENSVALAEALPPELVRISESGIRSARDAHYLRQHGYQGFLIGEQFMRQPDPGAACAKFVREFKALNQVEVPS